MTTGRGEGRGGGGRARSWLAVRWLSRVMAAAIALASAWTVSLAAPARENRPPLAKLKVNERDRVRHVVDADASDSIDKDGSIITYVFWVTDQQRGGLVSPVVELREAQHSFTLAPGTYRVHVTVTDNQGATSTVAKSVHIRGSRPPGATKPIPPIGVRIHTNLGDGRGVLLDSTVLAPDNPSPGLGGVHLAVLDRETTDSMHSHFYAAGSSSWTAFSTAVAATNSTQLVILSGMGAPASYSAAGFAAIKSAIERLGGDASGLSATSTALRTGRWSLIGHPGLRSGGPASISATPRSMRGRPRATSPDISSSTRTATIPSSTATTSGSARPS